MPKSKEIINPKRVRYIKLGRAGCWEKESLARGIIRFGFGSSSADRYPLCQAGKWNELTQNFINAGEGKGIARRFTNEARLFFEDDGSILWITFIGESLYWGFLDLEPAMPHEDGNGVLRKIKNRWRSSDMENQPLTKDRLSGALTKLAAYRGTSCSVDMRDYVIRRINGQKMPEVEAALTAQREMKRRALELIRMLGPRDFETLVDLFFSSSGWRRQGIIGKTQKTLDLDLILPSTGERAFVQVKSRTTTAELEDYIARFKELDMFDRMFYVYHSGGAITEDSRVTLMGPEKVAELAVETGLMNWLIRKVS